jgi:hypothetical protein
MAAKILCLKNSSHGVKTLCIHAEVCPDCINHCNLLAPPVTEFLCPKCEQKMVDATSRLDYENGVVNAVCEYCDTDISIHPVHPATGMKLSRKASAILGIKWRREYE